MECACALASAAEKSKGGWTCQELRLEARFSLHTGHMAFDKGERLAVTSALIALYASWLGSS